jgi:hypothetical protein
MRGLRASWTVLAVKRLRPVLLDEGAIFLVYAHLREHNSLARGNATH